MVGGADTPLENHYVNDILPNSSASKSGRVRTGDELLEANGQPLGGKTHAEALTIFRSLPAVVTLVVARKKDANRPILERLNHEKKDKKKVNNNIASPKRRRSVIEEAASASVIPRTLSSVIDVTKKACPHVKPVKRASRVSSFVGTAENELAENESSESQSANQEEISENGDNKNREEKEVSFTNRVTFSLLRVNEISVRTFQLAVPGKRPPPPPPPPPANKTAEVRNTGFEHKVAKRCSQIGLTQGCWLSTLKLLISWYGKQC